VLALAEALDDTARYRAGLLLAVARMDRNEYVEAFEGLEALRARPAPDPADELTLWRNGGFAALHLDRGPQAEAWLTRALELAEAHGAPDRPTIEAHLIHTRLSAGALDAAAELCAHSVARLGPQDVALDVANVRQAASRVAESQGDVDACVAHAEQALALFAATQTPLQAGNVYLATARVLADHHRIAEARAMLEPFDAQPNPAARSRYSRGLVQARLLWAEGRVADALDCLRAAIALLDDQPAVAVNGRATLARYLTLAGDAAGALAVAEAAAALAPPGPPLLAIEATRAQHALAAGEAAAAAARLEAVLAGPSGLDEYWWLHHAWARALQGAARLALGDRPGAVDAVRNLRAVPAIQALAWSVRVAAGDALEDARALLAAGALPPVERALLERAVAEGRPFA